jgi:hypothetical protein
LIFPNVITHHSLVMADAATTSVPAVQSEIAAAPSPTSKTEAKVAESGPIEASDAMEVDGPKGV